MVKKSKGFRELLRQEHDEQFYQQKALDKLEQNLQNSSLGGNVQKVLRNPKGQEKMSAVLEAFVEPYLDSVETKEERETLFNIAVAAWNLALISEEKRQALMDELVDEVLSLKKTSIQQSMKAVLKELIDRKQEFFADNQRCILKIEIEDLGNRFNLSVASTPAPGVNP